jgi:hypothetical protein
MGKYGDSSLSAPLRLEYYHVTYFNLFKLNSSWKRDNSLYGQFQGRKNYSHFLSRIFEEGKHNGNKFEDYNSM